MVLPWKAGNYLILGTGNVFVLLGRRISDGKTGVQDENHRSPFGLVLRRGLNRIKAALLLYLNNQHM